MPPEIRRIYSPLCGSSRRDGFLRKILRAWTSWSTCRGRRRTLSSLPDDILRDILADEDAERAREEIRRSLLGID
ncbi:uncharacterized protein DUF1127 [Roseibium marinum]|uniref:Uncharacterized protein DUF1127 n=1 Tax=Roseibium marinum TaxID=281252 RepID=A0A2S3UKN5_9HYPH|nr:uncharacterized protein DUF1127 [Roseibium marinum]